MSNIIQFPFCKQTAFYTDSIIRINGRKRPSDLWEGFRAKKGGFEAYVRQSGPAEALEGSLKLLPKRSRRAKFCLRVYGRTDRIIEAITKNRDLFDALAKKAADFGELRLIFVALGREMLLTPGDKIEDIISSGITV